MWNKCYYMIMNGLIKRTRHGGRKDHVLYETWCNVRRRCYNPNHHLFHRYGGRGIVVCEQWLGEFGFEQFVSDMGEKPSSKHTLDRINNDGNYEPTNCQWSAPSEQQANRSNNCQTVGVSWHKASNMWRAEIYQRGVRKYANFKQYSEAVKQRLAWENQLNIGVTA